MVSRVVAMLTHISGVTALPMILVVHLVLVSMFTEFTPFSCDFLTHLLCIPLEKRNLQLILPSYLLLSG